MASGELVRIETSRAVVTAAALEESADQRRLLGAYIEQQMVEGEDYGVIPGTERKDAKGNPAPTPKALLKPGAEKLVGLFRCVPKFTIEKEIENWDTGLFFYRITCQIETAADGSVVAVGVGSCSTYESRYRWRTQDRACPVCGAAAILRSKFPPRDNPEAEPGWYCYAKKGGCGANFDADDAEIIHQKVGRVQNPDLCDAANTVLKMSKKRALVDAAIGLARCSDIFTQDVGDDEQSPATQPTKAAPTRQPQSSKPAVDPIDTHRKKIKATRTLVELVAVWNAMPGEAKRLLLADKDQRKAELTPAATPTPAASEPPDLESLLDRKGVTAGIAATWLNEQFGDGWYDELPPENQLDPDHRTALIEHLTELPDAQPVGAA